MPGPNRKPVGVIGLGLLGTVIARRLLDAGFEVVGLDKAPGRVEDLGIEAVASVAEMAARVDSIVLCLPGSPEVEEVCTADGGILGARERRVELVVDCTTGDPLRSEAVAAQMADAAIAFVEAGVSGSSELFGRGEAALLAGASPEAIEAARGILDALSPVVFHLGPVGSGARMKLVSNLVVGLNRLVLAEAVNLAEKAGIPASHLLEVLRSGPGHSRAVELKGRKMAEGDYEPEARLAQHLRDVELILDLGRRVDAQLPLSTLHRELLERAVGEGLGELDNSAVVEVLRKLSGPQEKDEA